MENPAASISLLRVNAKSIMVVAAVDAVMFRIALDNTPNLGFTFPSKAKEYINVPVDIRLRPTNIHNTLSIAVFNCTPNIVAEDEGNDQAKIPAATSGMYRYFFNFSGGMIVVNVSIFIKVAYDITRGAKNGLKPTLINDWVSIPRNKYKRQGIPLNAADCKGDNWVKITNKYIIDFDNVINLFASFER